MTRFLAGVLALAAAVSLAARAAGQERYRFVKESPSRVGWTYLLAERTDEGMEQRVELDGQVLDESKEATETEFECVVEVLAVEGRNASEVRLSFRSATQRSGGQDSDLGLAGKTVLAKGVEGRRSFSFEDGSAPDAGQAAFLESAFDGSRLEGAPDIGDAFFPGLPVAVGDSWDVPIDVLARGFDLPVEFDAARSSASCRLEEVREREGTKFATLAIDVSLVPVSASGMRLSEGKMTITGTLEEPVDGTVPYGKRSVRMEFQGSGEAQDEGRTYPFTLRVHNDTDESRDPVE